MREIEKNEQQIDNPTITETPESGKETENKKAQFGSSLDSFSSTGAAKRQEGATVQSETMEKPEHKADAEKAVETKSSSDTPEEKKENLGVKLDKLSTDGTEKDDAYINAMNNMSDYLNKHNYGREDYAEYSKDPEWQKLNADLQKSLGMEVTTYPTEEEKVLSKEEAMGNMADYLSEHNYGPDDYAEYSKDPEWQKLNTDLQKSLGMEVSTYEPETDETDAGQEFSETDTEKVQVIDAADIDMTYAQGMDDKNFWNHHGNTKEDYIKLAEKIPDVQYALDQGKTLDEIKKDPELRDTAYAYFDPKNMVKVEQQEDGTYSFADDGRHRIAAAQELGYKIPVEVSNIADVSDTSSKNE